MFSNLPITKGRSGERFMETLNNQPYYEDFFGKRNSDEFNEGAIHSCESEASEEDTSKAPRKPPANRFFKQFTTPKKPSLFSGLDRFGEIKKPGKQQLRSRASTLNSPETTATKIATPTKARSSQHSATSGKLKPRKNGLFRKAARRMNAPNTAGDALDQLLGEDEVNDFEDEFKTLEQESGDEFERPRKDSAAGATAAQLPPDPYTVEVTEAATGEGEDSVLDGDIEDNESEVEEAAQKKSRRGTRWPKGRATTSTAKKGKAAKPKYSLRKKTQKPGVASSDIGTPRRSSRVNKMQEEGLRSQANSKAKDIASNNRSKMTARAMVLRNRRKAKKTTNPAEKGAGFEEVYGRKRKAEMQAMPQSAKTQATKKHASKKQGADDAAKQEYFRAVYGRKSKAKADDVLKQNEWEPEYVDLVPFAVARAMETVKGWTEVDAGEDEVNVDEYVRMFRERW